MHDTTITTPKTLSPELSQQGANIIAVASGKGGVGKTWFSVTLAHALAEAKQKVLLFDGDLGLANIDVQLGLLPAHDMRQVLQGNLSLSQVIQKSENTGFDVIAGQSGATALANMPYEHILTLRSGLLEVAKNYDKVMIDLGAGIDRTVRTLASAAAKLIIVVNEEPTSLTDAYAFIKLTHAAGLADTVHVVVNSADNQESGLRVYETLSKACWNFLKIRPPLLGVVQYDAKVPDAIRHQTSILTRHPSTQATKDVQAIAKLLLK